MSLRDLTEKVPTISPCKLPPQASSYSIHSLELLCAFCHSALASALPMSCPPAPSATAATLPSKPPLLCFDLASVITFWGKKESLS